MNPISIARRVALTEPNFTLALAQLAKSNLVANLPRYLVCAAESKPPRVSGHSHSIVPGGLLVTSYTTRLTPFTSLMMRVAARPRKFMSKG